MALSEGNENENKKELNQAPPEQLINLIAEMQKKIDSLEQKNQPALQAGGLAPDQFAQLVSAISKSIIQRPEADSLKAGSFVQARDIDPNDFDKQGVRFSAFGTGYYIVDDKRNGFSVQTPFGNVLAFTYSGSRRNINAEGKVELATFSTYVSHSKIEQEWLRNHHLFGIKFFESASVALSANAERAQMISRFIDSLAAQDQHQVLGQCQTYGIPIGTDMRAMRLALAEKMVDNALNARSEATKRTLQENFEQTEFLNDKTVSAVGSRK